MRNNPFLAIGGLLATIAVYAGVYLGLKEFIFAAIAAFVAAWPLTLVEHGMSNNRRYWTVRHVARLVLLFVCTCGCGDFARGSERWASTASPARI